MHITPEQIARMNELRAKGDSYDKIAHKVGCSMQSVGYWLNAEYRERMKEKNREWAREYRKRRQGTVVLDVIQDHQKFCDPEWFSANDKRAQAAMLAADIRYGARGVRSG
jgi:hypothetical protein